MRTILLKLYGVVKNELAKEDGQDLIEYVLVAALIACAATAGMNSLATSINAAFTSLGTTLTTYTG